MRERISPSIYSGVNVVLHGDSSSGFWLAKRFYLKDLHKYNLLLICIETHS